MKLSEAKIRKIIREELSLNEASQDRQEKKAFKKAIKDAKGTIGKLTRELNLAREEGDATLVRMWRGDLRDAKKVLQALNKASDLVTSRGRLAAVNKIINFIDGLDTAAKDNYSWPYDELIMEPLDPDNVHQRWHYGYDEPDDLRPLRPFTR